MYQILKQSLKDPKNKTLLVDDHSEILEIENLEDAEKICAIFNANSKDFKYTLRKTTR